MSKKLWLAALAGVVIGMATLTPRTTLACEVYPDQRCQQMEDRVYDRCLANGNESCQPGDEQCCSSYAWEAWYSCCYP
jgi:hypothetical protein